MNEFIIVLFGENREVVIDDTPSGYETGDVIELCSGTHTISLRGDKNYSPLKQDISPSDTSPIKPEEVKFT